MTTFGDQVYEFGGAPVGAYAIPMGTQPRRLIVDPSGATPGAEFSTIQAAINAAISGDTIFVQPGTYAETLTVTRDYITIVGAQLGGYGRPDVAPAAGVALTVTGQGFVCKRMRFVSEDSDTVKQYGNGFKYHDCVFDGSAGQAATEANLRLVSSDTDDSLTASEGEIVDCLIRGSNGYGLATDVGANSGGANVGPTHVVVRGCRFISNAAEDIIAKNTGSGGAGCIQDCLFDRCFIGMGTSKNKATHIDIKTNGTTNNTGNVFAGCFINDDTINTTAVKTDTTGSSFIGCFSLDGVIDGDALD